MKAEELAATILVADSRERILRFERAIVEALRSYGLACAMAERERCEQVADKYQRQPDTLKEERHAATEIRNVIRSRPTGDELMKEIEG